MNAFVKNELVLPFKPFTLSEVMRIAKCDSSVLDGFIEEHESMKVKTGDDGWSTGLDYMQTFAVFVGQRYLDEGAEWDRASPVVGYLSMLKLETLQAEMRAGRAFPVPKALGLDLNCIVKVPDTPLGRKLDLRKLITEYDGRVHASTIIK